MEEIDKKVVEVIKANLEGTPWTWGVLVEHLSFDISPKEVGSCHFTAVGAEPSPDEISRLKRGKKLGLREITINKIELPPKYRWHAPGGYSPEGAHRTMRRTVFYAHEPVWLVEQCRGYSEGKHFCDVRIHRAEEYPSVLMMLRKILQRANDAQQGKTL
jgi:hypothetical protein